MECHGRCRLFTLLLSLLGLSVLLLVYLFSPSSSAYAIINMSPPKRSQKVSVFLCLPQASIKEIEDIEKELYEVFSELKLSHETFIVLDDDSTRSSSIHTQDLSSLPPPLPHHHREIISSPTCTSVLSKAHFSILLLIGANISYYKDTVKSLIDPLINGNTDLMLTYNVEESFSLWERLLLLSVYPLTGSIYVPSYPVLAILTPTLTQGCHDIAGQEERGGSLSVELVSRCALHDWSLVSTSVSNSHDNESTGSITISQVMSLWWTLHPFLCTFLFLILCIVITTVVVVTRRNSTRYNIMREKFVT